MNDLNIVNNLVKLNNLIASLPSIDHTKAGSLTQDTVSMAVAQVLKNVEPYVSGKQLLTDSQIKDISLKAAAMQQEALKKNEKRGQKQTLKANRLMSMLSRLREDQTRRPEHKLEDYYQAMGCQYAYGKWQEGDSIVGPDAKSSDYQVHKVIKNNKGLQLIVLVPKAKEGVEDKHAAPIICCRGTTGDLHNLVDDMKATIGKYSFMESKEEILAVLKEVTDKHGPAVLTGHSLGGALAQHITAEFCDQLTPAGHSVVKSVYHFNSPGVGSRTAQKYEQKLQKLPADIPVPEIFSYEHDRDIVVTAGGDHLKAQFRVLLHDPQDPYSTFWSFLKAPIGAVKSAHSWKRLVSEFERTDLSVTPRPFWQVAYRKVSEFGRRFFGNVGKRVLLQKIKQAEQLRDNANKINQFLKHA